MEALFPLGQAPPPLAGDAPFATVSCTAGPFSSLDLCQKENPMPDCPLATPNVFSRNRAARGLLTEPPRAGAQVPS